MIKHNGYSKTSAIKGKANTGANGQFWGSYSDTSVMSSIEVRMDGSIFRDRRDLFLVDWFSYDRRDPQGNVCPDTTKQFGAADSTGFCLSHGDPWADGPRVDIKMSHCQNKKVTQGVIGYHSGSYSQTGYVSESSIILNF